MADVNDEGVDTEQEGIHQQLYERPVIFLTHTVVDPDKHTSQPNSLLYSKSVVMNGFRLNRNLK